MCSSAKGEEGECCNSLVESYKAAREYFYSMLQKKTSKAHYKRVHSSTLLGESSRKVYTYCIMVWNSLRLFLRISVFNFFAYYRSDIVRRPQNWRKYPNFFDVLVHNLKKSVGDFFQTFWNFLWRSLWFF